MWQSWDNSDPWYIFEGFNIHNVTNATGICAPYALTDDNSWIVGSPGVVIICCFVITFFLCQYYIHRNDQGIWDSPWMFIFHGYLLMQLAAIFLFGYFFSDAMAHPAKTLMNYIGRFWFLMLDWGGYWCVGQFCIVGPLVDLKMFKWSRGSIFRTLNYVVCFGMLAFLAYLEFTLDEPFKNQLFKKIFDNSRILVYVGNLVMLVQVCVERWLCNIAGFLIFLATLVNFAGLTMFFVDFKNSRPPSASCYYYLLEGLALAILWFYLIVTRPLIQERIQNQQNGLIQNEYPARSYEVLNP